MTKKFGFFKGFMSKTSLAEKFLAFMPLYLLFQELVLRWNVNNNPSVKNSKGYGLVVVLGFVLISMTALQSLGYRASTWIFKRSDKGRCVGRVVGVILVVGFLVTVVFNTSIEGVWEPSLHTNCVEMSSSKLNNPVLIQHITDWHSNTSLVHAEKVIATNKTQLPNCVVFTGDIVTKNDEASYSHIEYLLHQLVQIQNQRVFMIGGDHDIPGFDFGVLVEVSFVNNQLAFVECPFGVDLGEIYLFGMATCYDQNGEAILPQNLVVPDSHDDKLLVAACHDPMAAKLLLRHYPWVDLVLAGETHGGQICLPFFGAVFAYNLTAWPEFKAKTRHLVKGLCWVDLDEVHDFNGGSSSIDGKSVIHICSGVGYASNMPIRFMCNPQISMLHIAPNNPSPAALE